MRQAHCYPTEAMIATGNRSILFMGGHSAASPETLCKAVFSEHHDFREDDRGYMFKNVDGCSCLEHLPSWFPSILIAGVISSEVEQRRNGITTSFRAEMTTKAWPGQKALSIIFSELYTHTPRLWPRSPTGSSLNT